MRELYSKGVARRFPSSTVQHSTEPAELYRNKSCDRLRDVQVNWIGVATQVSGS